jgi:tetratricopeptide (TPR) repeat protein
LVKKYPTITFLLFLIAWRAYSQPDAELASRLSSARSRDDLSGWIYAQIQWTAKAPASRSGQLADAVRGTWREPHSPEEQQAWLDLLTNEGYSMLLRGAIVPSTDAYTAAYDYARRHPAITDAGLVLETVLKPLGNNYTRLGDYEQALYIHQKAAALALALGDREALAGVYSNLANTCGNMGRSLQARDYCFKGLAVVRPHSAMAGLLFSELADAYRGMGVADSAKIFIRESISILRVAHDHPSAGYWLLTAYEEAGDLYGETSQALGYYQQALRLQGRLALTAGELRQRDRAKLYWRLGSMLGVLGRKKESVGEKKEAMGRKEESVRWLDSCLAVLLPGKDLTVLRPSDLYAENTLADALYALAGEATDADVAIRYYELSFAAGKKGRQELITTSSKERWVSDVRGRFERALGVAWDAWSRTRLVKYAYAMLGFMESSKAQLLLDEQLQHQQSGLDDSLGRRIRLLEKARVYYQKEMVGGGDSAALSGLRETDWELAKLRKMKPGLAVVGPSSLLLPEGLVTRSYFAGDTVLYTVECGHSGIRYVDRLSLGAGWQDSVRAFMRYWFEAGANHMIDDPGGYYRQAGGLYDRFFAAHPFDSGLAYILLPDGALSLLPVEALVVAPRGGTSGAAGAPGAPESWPFVVRRAEISYGYSIQTLQRGGTGVSLQERRGAGDGGFSGFFLAANQRDLPGLKATLEEKSGIEPFVREGHWYVDSSATVAAFKEALTGSSIVHISSHAFAARDSLDAPHIELYDAPFYLFEPFDLHPSLVVLSACRTGDGRFVSGEGVQSLARGFLAGGAGAVVAGWWNVNDEVAASIMADFYARMASVSGGRGASVNAALALRQSKLDWLDDASREPLLHLPYYWAALSYTGNPEPFKDRASSGLVRRGGIADHERLLWGVIAGLVFILMSVWWIRRRKSRSAARAA